MPKNTDDTREMGAERNADAQASPEREKGIPNETATRDAESEADRIPAGNRFRILLAVLLALVLLAGGFYTGLKVQGKRMDTQIEAARNRIMELEIQTGERNSDGSPRVEEDNVAILSGVADLDPETKDMMGDSIQTDANTVLIGEDSLTDESVIVAEFKGGTVNAAEAMAEYDDLVFVLSMDGEDARQNADLFRRAIDSLIARKVAYARAEELGLTEYSEEDESRAAAIAQENNLSQGEVLEDYWRFKLRAEIGKDVSITDDAARKEYDMRAFDEKEYYEREPDEYARALESGEEILYYAAPARSIRYKVVPFSDEDRQAARELLKNGDSESLAAYDALCEKYAEGLSGADRSLTGAKSAVVTASSGQIDIIQASDITTIMGMKKGDLIILRGPDGVAAVACDEAYEAGKREPSQEAIEKIRGEMLDIALDKLYNETVDSWVEQASPVYHDEDLY